MSAKFYDLKNLQGDIYGGLTASVVALPLALAFGVASGAGAIAGLYGAILVGFFAALFGGTPAQVSGPTGPMTVVMTGIIMQFGHEPALAFTVVVLGGIFQIVFGILNLGRFITYVPFPVVSGFMSGIGCIIIALQIGPFLGHSSSQSGVIAAIAKIPFMILNPEPNALFIGVFALAIMIFFPKKLRSIAPPPLVALIMTTLIATVFFIKTPIIGDIPSGLPEPTFPLVEATMLPTMIGSALILAALGSIDSLLTSLVADRMSRTQHRPKKELIGQGIGNIAAGLLGGIPGAGATMRTVVNIKAGGKTPLSGILHALVLLALVLGLGPFAEKIPHAVLAGILLKVGYDIIDWSYLRRLRNSDKDGIMVMLTVLLVTIFFDLIVAVGLGIVIHYFLNSDHLNNDESKGIKTYSSDGDNESLSSEEKKLIGMGESSILLVTLNDTLTYASSKMIVKKFSVADNFLSIVLDFSNTSRLDTTAALAIEECIFLCRENGQQLILAGIRADIRQYLDNMMILSDVPAKSFHVDRADALRYAVETINQRKN